MKTINYKLIAIIFLLIITSCITDDSQINPEEQSTLKRIKEITNQFIHSQQNNFQSSTKVFVDPKVAAIDINAAIDSYNDDGDFDWALTMGVAASSKASSGIMPNNPGGNVTNDFNEYDFTGRYHVEILQHGLTDKKDFIFENGIFNYYNSITYSNEFLESNNLNVQQSNIYSLSQFEAFYNTIISNLENVNNQLSKIILQMENDGKISNLESQILNMYFESQENSTSLNSFIQYSLQIENLITESNFNISTKKLLLFSMSTTRHDINFWNPYSS